MEDLLATEKDSAEVAEQSAEEFAKASPFRNIASIVPGSNAFLVVDKVNQSKVDEYLAMPEIKRLLPTSMNNVKFVWGRSFDSSYTDEDGNKVEGPEQVRLYVLQSNRRNEPLMSGDIITSAISDFDPTTGKPIVKIQFTTEAGRDFERISGMIHTNKTGLAVVLDDIVYTAPGVKDPISGGSCVISGDFEIKETQDIANVISAGKLPAKAEILQSEVVGPSLGQESIQKGYMSFIIAMILVLIWMVVYYGKAGLFANIALVFNIVLIFGVLTNMGAVLTLPGIAGIVLTIGMSVDANVLIFERIKEELQRGKGKMEAIKDGFGNALSSILDANITTFLTAIILFFSGFGPIKGFATTLMIGIATSLFTAIFVTRLTIDSYLSGKDRKLTFSTPLTKNLFKGLSVDFLGKRKMTYVISGILVLVSVVGLFTNGLELDVEFKVVELTKYDLTKR